MIQFQENAWADGKTHGRTEGKADPGFNLEKKLLPFLIEIEFKRKDRSWGSRGR